MRSGADEPETAFYFSFCFLAETGATSGASFLSFQRGAFELLIVARVNFYQRSPTLVSDVRLNLKSPFVVWQLSSDRRTENWGVLKTYKTVQLNVATRAFFYGS